MPTPPVLALTDRQLDLIHRLAAPLAPEQRAAFLEAVATALRWEPALGDGTVYRVALEQQRRFWTPPLERQHVSSKWSR